MSINDIATPNIFYKIAVQSKQIYCRSKNILIKYFPSLNLPPKLQNK